MNKIFVLLQTYIDYLNDYNEETKIIGVYKDKSKAEWIIECIIEQHPEAYNKTNNSFHYENSEQLIQIIEKENAVLDNIIDSLENQINIFLNENQK